MTQNISFNFGAIRDTVTRLSAVELVREQKSITLDKFLKEIKQSPALTKQQFVFKNIESAKPFTKERLAERFIAQNMQLFKNEQWNNIKSENKRIRKELLDDFTFYVKIFVCIIFIFKLKMNFTTWKFPCFILFCLTQSFC